MARQNGGILFVYHDQTGWEVLLGKRAAWLAYGADNWQGTGGGRQPGEDLLATAFRETKEEWCGGTAVEDFFAACLPAGFHREQVRDKVHVTNYVVWQFHTFLVKLTERFQPAHLRLNDEFTEAKWFSAAELPQPRSWTLSRALRHFELE